MICVENVYPIPLRHVKPLGKRESSPSSTIKKLENTVETTFETSGLKLLR